MSYVILRLIVLIRDSLGALLQMIANAGIAPGSPLVDSASRISTVFMGLW